MAKKIEGVIYKAPTFNCQAEMSWPEQATPNQQNTVSDATSRTR